MPSAKLSLTMSKAIAEWFIPADFMYGYTKEDDHHYWPQFPSKVTAWNEFTLQILHLTGQHPPGHSIVVDITKLDVDQIACAFKSLSARGFLVSFDKHRLTMQITSRQLRRSARIFAEAMKDVGY